MYEPGQLRLAIKAVAVLLGLTAWLVSILVARSALATSEPKAPPDDLRALIEKAVKAHGGADKLDKLKAVRITIAGTAELGGGPLHFTAELTTRLPDKQRVVFTLAGETASSLRIINGEKGWNRADNKTEDLTGAPLDDARASMHQLYVRSLLPLLKGDAFRLSPLGEMKVQERPAVGIRAEATGRVAINLYFDKATGLLVKTERRALGLNQQEVTLESYYRDYKAVDGVQAPMTVLLHHDGKQYMKQEVTEVQFLDQIDDREFARP